MPYCSAAMSGPFDAIAQEYDRWYESGDGAIIFREEIEALQLVKGRAPGRWLEVGVGTGRFAEALGISDGIDPSREMLALASERGIHTESGIAEALPYGDAVFDGVLAVAALCFVDSPARVFNECARVLKPMGVFVAGMIPRTSPWGEEYTKKAAAGHPVYSHAKFSAIEETVCLAADAGLILHDAASALLWAPSQRPMQECRVVRGARPDAGFVALRFEFRAA